MRLLELFTRDLEKCRERFGIRYETSGSYYEIFGKAMRDLEPIESDDY
jgi:hypothetical protein